MSEQTDSRNAQRRRVIKGGVIAYSSRQVTSPCAVRDLSESGARLQVHRPLEIPDTFDLLIELDGFEAECAVVWRTEKELGVKFLVEPKQVAPKRVQIVSGLEHTSKSSIRRERPGVGLSDQGTSAERHEPAIAPVAPVQADGARPAAPVAQAAVESVQPVATASPVQTGNPVHGATVSSAPNSAISILVAEDDPDDRLLIREAFAESDFDHQIDFVANGEELLQYLFSEGGPGNRIAPRLILLDLNMPRMDGRVALQHLKANPATRRIPVVVFTTSNADQDIDDTYELGVSSYITKPSSFEGLKDVVRALDIYWSGMVALPTANRA